jgi:hypothetical protein
MKRLACLAPPLLVLACSRSAPSPAACDPGFGGPDCTAFAAQLTPPGAGLHDDHASFWDGSSIQGDDGRFYLFASRFANGCGLSTWATNSECVRASAASPLGPFQVDEVVVPAFCHNPSVRRLPDGSYVLFSIGEPVPASALITTCLNGRTLSMPSSTTLHTSTCVIQVRSAPALTGPWSAPKSLTAAAMVPLCPTNPAPVVNQDGSITLVFRSYQLEDGGTVERLFRTDAPAFDGPYTFGALDPIFQRPGEDPFVWRASTGGLRMLFNDKFTDAVNVGGLAVADDGTTWAPSGSAYGLDVAMSDGSTLHVARRERPSILWTHAKNAVLYTGVLPSGDADDRSYVVATPLTPSVD